MVFDCVPSDIRQVYWQYTQNDLRVRIRLYLGQRQAGIVQSYQTLAKVAGDLFSDNKRPSADTGNADIPKTRDEAIAQFSSVFGKK